MSNKYFGTDGFRGEVNVNLTAEHAYKIGRFLGWYFKSPICKTEKTNQKTKVVIGKDTRRSSYMLEYALCSGIIASGGDAYILHVTTTPSVSYVTRTEGFDCGVMITASHNPFYDNGIKIINRYGEKIDDKITDLIEKYIDGELDFLGGGHTDLPFALREEIGAVVDYVSGRNRYIGYLISLASHSYKNLKIGLDCANGASWSIARSVFDALGAKTFVVGDKPNGTNINDDCGSTHIENLCQLVRQNHLDVGFAFDGDSDRCIAVDEKGNVVDGDKMMYVLAKRLKGRDMLNDNTVVATIMSNNGFVNSLKQEDINCVLTTVGDRFVYECMQQNDYDLGGEQSGHIIIKKYATTGDGLLTAIMITEELCDKKATLSKLCEGVFLYPQFTKNVHVNDKEKATTDKLVQKSLKEIEQKIDGKGRVLLRKSGTEPVVRIMVECENENLCREYAEYIANVISKVTS
ncbi:MAG: phosphoglucosamine mutase [Clostridia bacterium]|nr:phosphoglucosamine mutase [Clostridia bacterium]